MKSPVAVLLVHGVLALHAGCGVPTERSADPTATANLDDAAGALELAASDGNGPVITSVETDDGFTQIRQAATVSLVIRGKRLQRTESVTIADFFVTLDSVSARELRITVSTFGATPPGPLDVSLTSSHGTLVQPGAIELTPFVVSPTAVPGAGHGTFQSPMHLCDSDLQNAGVGNRVILLAGTHRCGSLVFLQPGATVEGDPAGGTILTGTADGGLGMVFVGGSDPISVLRDVTFAQPLAFAISVGSGGMLVERVVDHGGGIEAFGERITRIDHYAYDGDGVGIDTAFAEVTNTTIRHCGANPGIRVSSGGFASFASATIDHVVVEDCDPGITVGFAGGRRDANVTVRNTELVDNRVGMLVLSGSATLNGVVIHDNPATPAPASVGISQGSGDVSVSNVEITGYADIGISIVQTSSLGFDASLFADRLTITGGRIGVEFQGIDNQLSMQNSIVRDQTEAALHISSIDSSIDLGFPGFPGNNQLSVISGFVIDDDRRFNSTFNAYIFANGTTLNGVSFDGQTIDGPAELAPFYRFQFHDAGIQF